jgi:penicillin amidase
MAVAERAGWPVPPALLAPAVGRLSAANAALLAGLPGLSGSNSWVLAPDRSATGNALLANDPHLGHGLPGIWYEAHLRTPQHEVIGVFIPGVPLAIVGHNRHIAWGLVNLQLDAGDFFLERLHPQRPGQVAYRGGWVPLAERTETIHVKGGQPVTLTVRSTPHGPLVHDLLEGQEQALSYRWSYAVASDANEINGFYDLNRARDWAGFRAAVSQFGAVAQTATYADRAGHIGMQATGRIPNRKGRKDGLGYRVGWTGAEEWDGFLPFEANPSERDPGRGYVAVANHPLQRPPPYYLSGYYEPEDRIARIRELIARKERHSVEDLARMQNDALFVTGRALAPEIVAAFDAAPTGEPALRAAVEALRRWDGTMAMDSRGAAVFAVFYRHLFPEVFGDELDAATLEGMRTLNNHSAVALHAVLKGAPADGGARWLDRQDTPAVEDRAAIFRAALAKAAAELAQRLGSDPAAWRWGDLHQIELQHPLGRVRALAPLFNVGPAPMPGHAQTVNKTQFTDADYRVYQGPSMRQLTDLGDIARAQSVLPAGQSGIPASPHYADQFPLWRNGQYHPLLMDREDLAPLTVGRLVLQP